jgi:hypothetical protein
MMTRTRSLLFVAAMVAGMAGTGVGVTGCNFRAGVQNNPTGAAGVTGAAGTGTAGAGGAGGMDMTGVGGSPFTFGNQFGGAGGTTGQSEPCENLQCQQSTCRGGTCTVTCPAGQRTTVSGTVYDPAGNVPLYNITVYVPNAVLDDIKDGPSCDPCDQATGTSLLSGKPVSITKTDTAGKFSLGDVHSVGGDVPAGTNVPLVIQVGKWRRQITIPTVTACMDNPIMDKSLTRLPRNSTEGHIPKMALTTGGSDAMECLLRKIGIDDGEFSTEAGTARVNFYAGGGGTSSFLAQPTAGGALAFTAASPWWDSLANLQKYDLILHSCEGGQGSYPNNDATNPNAPGPISTKSMQARMALQQYADMGGRVFASHWHTYWFEQGTPDFMSIATFLNPHGPGLMNPTDTTIDQSFDKGQALAQWMVGPLVMGSTVLGTVSIAQDASNTEVAMAAGPPISQRWIYAPTQNNTVLFLSATTPIPNTATPKPNACGRVVLSDLHVSAGGKGSDMPNTPFPMGCVTTTLSPREKVLEFMLFDIASCVAPIVQ